jgi:hypothetical protein
MDAKKFDAINEELKLLISNYQIKRFIPLHQLDRLQKRLVTFIDDDYEKYEDLAIKLKSAYNKISQGHFELLPTDYHDALWRIHQRMMKSGKLKPPRIFKKFHDACKTKTKKYYFGNMVLCQLGKVEGHCITVTADDGKITMEYNDHSPMRTENIAYRLFSRKWKVSKIMLMQNVFPKGQTQDNYFFTAEFKSHWFFEEELEWLGNELSMSINTDWILISSENHDPDKLAIEKSLTRIAYDIYDICGILPADTLQALSKLYDKKNR